MDDEKGKEPLKLRVARRFGFLNYVALGIFAFAAIITLFK